MIRLPAASSSQATLLPDLTPLLDVIFIVLVFFLLTAQTPLLERALLLPQDQQQSAQALQPEAQRRLLELDATGAWRLDAEPLGFAALRDQLHGQSQPALDLAIDRQAPLAEFLDLIVLLQEQGVEDVRMLMESTPDAP